MTDSLVPIAGICRRSGLMLVPSTPHIHANDITRCAGYVRKVKTGEQDANLRKQHNLPDISRPGGAQDLKGGTSRFQKHDILNLCEVP